MIRIYDEPVISIVAMIYFLCFVGPQSDMVHSTTRINTMFPKDSPCVGALWLPLASPPLLFTLLKKCTGPG